MRDWRHQPEENDNEAYDDWIIYVCIWRDNGWTAPGYIIGQWHKQGLTKMGRKLADVLILGKINIQRK